MLEEKSLFKMLGLSFISKLDYVSYIRSVKFLSPDFGLYFFKSTAQPRMEYKSFYREYKSYISLD